MFQTASLLLVFSLASSAQAQYAITDLGPLYTQDTTTSPGTVALDMNEQGTVVGYAVLDDFAPSFYGARWTGLGVALEPLSGDLFAAATAINDDGFTVGVSYNLGDIERSAVVWKGADAVKIGEFTPSAINNGGLVVGSRARGALDPVREAILWQDGEGATALPILGTSSAVANDVNNGADIVGSSQNFFGEWRAVLWRGGSIIDLGTLGGAWSQALAVSNAGYVVGVSETSGGEHHAFRYDLNPDGSVALRVELLPLHGSSSHAYDVNNDGVAVGVSDSRAVRWDGATPVDLNTQIGPAAARWRLVKSTSVSDLGQITGLGYLDGIPRSFLLTPGVAPCPGDCDESGSVNFADLVAMLFEFGTPGTAQACDADDSGSVNFGDLVAALFTFGPCT